MAVPPAPVQVPSQRPLAPSVASVTSVANGKGDNEMILGAVYTDALCFLQHREYDSKKITLQFTKTQCSKQSEVYSSVGSYAKKTTKKERKQNGQHCTKI